MLMITSTNVYQKCGMIGVLHFPRRHMKSAVETKWISTLLPIFPCIQDLTGKRFVYKMSSEVVFERGSNVVIDGKSENFPLSSYETAMDKLSSLITRQRRGEKPPVPNKLERMSMYLKILGLEEDIDRLNIIHVAGTKGKGSTCIFCEAILRECGFRTGVFTSPHLIDVCERFRIDGIDISEDKFLQYFWDCWNKLEENSTEQLPMPPLFQFLAILAFKIFISEQVDAAIIEVGLGGKEDSTNVIKEPTVCGITSLGMDHTEILGDTLGQIASHKAGIFKPKVPAFTVPQPPEAMDVILERARELMVPLEVTEPFDYKQLKGSKLGLSGDHQFSNAALAVSLCKCWLQRTGNWEKSFQNDFEDSHLPNEFIRGLSTAHFSGRAQIVYDSYTNSEPSAMVSENSGGELIFYLDGAHSPESIEACAKWFSNAVMGCKIPSHSSFGIKYAAEESSKNVHHLNKSKTFGEFEKSSRQILLFNCLDVRNPQILLPLLVNTCASSGIRFSRALFVPSMSKYTKVTSAVSIIPSDLRGADLSWQFNLQRIWEKIMHGKEITTSFEKDFIRDSKEIVPPNELLYQNASKNCSSHNHFACSAVIPSLPLTIKWLRDCAKEHPSTRLQVLVTGSLHLVGDVLKLLKRTFKACPHPNDSIRRQLSLELGLEPKQVKFWFQNKRTQAKAQSERTGNTALRQENERMLAENFIFREALKNVLCLSCGGPTLRGEESELRMHQLRLENALLKQEHQRISQLLESYNVISPMFQEQHVSLSSPSSASTPISSFSETSLLNPEIEIASLCQRFHALCQNNSSASSLDQHVSTLAQHTHALGGQHNILALDQGAGAPTFHDQHSIVPIHDQQIVPVNDQDMIPVLDQDVPAALGHQEFPALAPALDDQDNVPAQSVTLDQENVLGVDDQDYSASVHGISNDDMLPVPVSAFADEERGKMEETATNAMEELARLLRMNEPFWFRSTVDGKFILQRQSYEKIFHKANRLKGPRVRRESSKDSRLVVMNGTELVDMFIDSEKWVSLFPTIVKRAYTIEVLDSGLAESRSGALQLMYAEMHILSPMVPSREFFFLRYCIQVDVGVWVIADVSFNSPKFSTIVNSPAWRLPSGCLIHDMNDGSCRVTWVEHVEVNDKTQTHPIFRDLVCGGNAFGAERWVLTLERMCERFAFASMDQIPSCDAGGVITLPDGRRNVMELSQRMVKLFCGALDMSDNVDFPYVKVNNGGVRVSIRNSSEPGVPKGMIVTAATSFWLPLLPHALFNFLKDPTTRAQWDVLCHGNPVTQLQHISNGTYSDNCTSIIRPCIPIENDMLLLQECCADPLGCVVVYAPVDVATMSAAINGDETTTFPILPSGFTIAGDGSAPGESYNGCGLHVPKLGGSLLTVAIQVLVCSPTSMDQLDMDTVAAVNTLATSTVEKIKAALNCSELL